MARTGSAAGTLVLLAAIAASGQGIGDASEPLSPRNANYRIEVTLDPEARTLTGRETLYWRNLQEIPAEDLRFHLYWNAWRNDRSTWLLESRRRPRDRNREEPQPEDWSWSEVRSVKLVPDIGVEPVDLTSTVRWAAPDDGNAEDRTLMVVPLPEAVPPQGVVQIDLEWTARVPRTFARTGYRGDFYFIAQWFPKLAVFEADGWNAHQFHASTEFYSDYGVYDVTITAPSRFVVGATGREVETAEEGGLTRHRFHQADVHDFAWTASPDYLVLEERFEEPGLPPVDMRLLLQPEHRPQAERHFEATRAALRNYGSWYGPYPYGHITVVDPAYGSGAGGMEYPTLFTSGTRLFNPVGGGSPEGVTVHEAGHQFWYGIVGNDEFEDAWMDEGLNTFSTARTMDVTFGESALVERYLSPPGMRDAGFLPVLFREIRRSRGVGGNRLDRYRNLATADVQATPSWRYDPASAGAHSYAKTALWLHTLERHLGWETLQRILSSYFERFAFAHPRPEDFFAVADEVSGQDLGWYFDRVYRSSETFDYAVASVSSEKIEVHGWREVDGELVPASEAHGSDTPGYRTEVVVRRLGGAAFPVKVLMTFEDGSRVLEDWDGEDRWKLYVHEGPSRLEWAAVDPERVLLLDLDYTNNSRRIDPEATLPAVKWGSKWMLWLQDMLTAFAFFV